MTNIKEAKLEAEKIKEHLQQQIDMSIAHFRKEYPELDLRVSASASFGQDIKANTYVVLRGDA